MENRRERIEQIRLRWTNHDNMGIAHPIIESELDEDIQFLLDAYDNERKESKRRLDGWHRANKIIDNLEERLEESRKLNRYLESQLDKKADFWREQYQREVSSRNWEKTENRIPPTGRDGDW